MPFFPLCSPWTWALGTFHHGIVCRCSIFCSMEPRLNNFSGSARILKCILINWVVSAEYLMIPPPITIRPMILTLPMVGWVGWHLKSTWLHPLNYWNPPPQMIPIPPQHHFKHYLIVIERVAQIEVDAVELVVIMCQVADCWVIDVQPYYYFVPEHYLFSSAWIILLQMLNLNQKHPTQTQFNNGEWLEQNKGGSLESGKIIGVYYV